MRFVEALRRFWKNSLRISRPTGPFGFIWIRSTAALVGAHKAEILVKPERLRLISCALLSAEPTRKAKALLCMTGLRDTRSTSGREEPFRALHAEGYDIRFRQECHRFDNGLQMYYNISRVNAYSDSRVRDL